jgi:hypothetical protein
VTGSEAAIAGGTAAAGQAVLSAVFGDQAVRDLVRDAQVALHDRVQSLFDQDRTRFTEMLDRLPDHDDADRLRSLGAAVRSAP